jgi:hypothetical protein
MVFTTKAPEPNRPPVSGNQIVQNDGQKAAVPQHLCRVAADISRTACYQNRPVVL